MQYQCDGTTWRASKCLLLACDDCFWWKSHSHRGKGAREAVHTSMYVAFGERRSIPKRYYELRLILMIFRARKTRWARIWMRFYGGHQDFSHEKLGLKFFRQNAELVLRRGHRHRVQYREFTRTKRTLSPSSNREHVGSTNPVRESVQQ